MRSSFWLIILLGLAFLIHYSYTTYPPQEWRDYAIGRFYFFNGDKKRAEEEFRKALENPQTSSEVLIEMGKLFLSVGDWGKGEEFIRKAVEKHPSASSYYLLGQCLYLQGKLKEAEETLQKALELDPTNPYVLNDLAYIWVDQGKRLEEAVAMLERAVRKVQSPEVLDSLGWAYVKTGRLEEGLKVLKKAVQLNPYSWELRYHLGVAYEKLGKPAFAKVELGKAEILHERASRGSSFAL